MMMENQCMTVAKVMNANEIEEERGIKRTKSAAILCLLAVAALFLVRFTLADSNLIVVPSSFSDKNATSNGAIENKQDGDSTNSDATVHPWYTCFNWTLPSIYCQRFLISGHKLGWSWSYQHFGQYEKIQIHDIFYGFPLNCLQTDFRHVIMTRNMYSTFVSGYLYHLTGHECWLDMYGISNEEERNWNWEQYLSFPHPYPPRQGRSLCRYLANETEEDGLRVLIDLGLNKWYKELIPYWHKANDTEEVRQNILFMCYEEILEDELHAFSKMMNWFYPGEELHPITLPEIDEEKKKGHATSKEPELRDRLKRIIKKHDEEIFNHTLRKINELYGCHEEVY